MKQTDRGPVEDLHASLQAARLALTLASGTSSTLLKAQLVQMAEEAAERARLATYYLTRYPYLNP